MMSRIGPVPAGSVFAPVRPEAKCTFYDVDSTEINEVMFKVWITCTWIVLKYILNFMYLQVHLKSFSSTFYCNII